MYPCIKSKLTQYVSPGQTAVWAKIRDIFDVFLNSFCEQTTNAREDMFTSTDASIPPDSKYVRNFYVTFLVRES